MLCIYIYVYIYICVCIYIYMCVYIYIYMHVREVYEFYKWSEGYRLLFWTCEPTNLSWASILFPSLLARWWTILASHVWSMAWSKFGPTTSPNGFSPIGCATAKPKPPQQSRSRKKRGHCSWDMGIRCFWWFLAWIDTDCPCVRRMEYPFGAWRCKTSRWTTPRGKPVAWHRAAWDGQKAAGRIIYMIYL